MIAQGPELCADGLLREPPGRTAHPRLVMLSRPDAGPLFQGQVRQQESRKEWMTGRK